MKAEFTNRALKDFKSLDKVTQKQIIKKLCFYLDAPDPLSFAKRLTDPKDGDYRFRIGTYRVVFDVEASVAKILRVQHRKDVYRQK